MTYSIVYSSVTGNTEQLAQAIQQAVGATYCGKPSDEALAADTIFIGFWSTRYSCGADIQAFMKQLSGKKVFLFGTAGFGDTKEFYENYKDLIYQKLKEKIFVLVKNIKIQKSSLALEIKS